MIPKRPDLKIQNAEHQPRPSLKNVDQLKNGTYCKQKTGESTPHQLSEKPLNYFQSTRIVIQTKQNYLHLLLLQRKAIEFEIDNLKTKIAENKQSIKCTEFSHNANTRCFQSRKGFDSGDTFSQPYVARNISNSKILDFQNPLRKRSSKTLQTVISNAIDTCFDLDADGIPYCMKSHVKSVTTKKKPQVLMALDSTPRSGKSANKPKPTITRVDLSGRDYDNFRNLLGVLTALFQNKPLTASQLRALNSSERLILKSFLVRKRLLSKSAPYPTDTAFYNRPALFRSQKRKEEQLKSVLSMCLGLLRDQFARANPMSFESRIRSNLPLAELKEAAFFDSYFGEIARSEDLHLSVFYLPATRRKRTINDRRLRTINKVYVNLLRRSQSFMADFRSLLRGDFTDLSGTVRSVASIWKQRLTDKLKNKITLWNQLIRQVGWSAGVARICENIESNKRYVMPWSEYDMVQAIEQVNRVFFE